MAKIFVSFNLVSTADFLLVAVESAFPLTEVYRSAVLTPPHTQRNITIDSINPVMHKVQLWTTSDGVALDELKGQCDIDASISNASAFTLIQFIVDRGNGAPEYDPVSEQGQYVNPDLDGKEYVVFKPGFGALVWDVHIQALAGGGFEFINGWVFANQEEYTVMVFNEITTQELSISGTVSDVILFTANRSIVTGDAGKILAFNFAGNVGVATFPSLATLNGKSFIFNTHQGSQVNGEIAFQSGEGASFLTHQNGGVVRNKIYLGKGEEIRLFIKAGVAYVEYYNGCYDKVGRRIFGEITNDPNTLVLDGNGGTEYDGLVYKRAWEFITTRLPAGQQVTYAQWNATVDFNYAVALNPATGTTQILTQTIFVNRGFFAVDSVNKKFKVPDDRGKSYRGLLTLDNLDASDTTRQKNVSGGYQHWGTGPHHHRVNIQPLNCNSASGSGKIATGNDSVEGTFNQLDTFGDTQDLESRMINTGQVPLIII